MLDLSNYSDLNRLKGEIKLINLKFKNMKTLITLIITLALVITTSNLFGQSKTKGIAVQTIENIEAPVSEVYDILRSLERFPEWSPFKVTDPEQKTSVTGPDGEVGAVFHWEGVAEKSKGTQTISELTEDSYLLMNCDIEVPYESQGIFEYVLTEKDGETIVTQNFTVPCSGFQKFMMKLFGAEKHMAEINALGLERLKALAEQEAEVLGAK